jgi:hypothetical protein
VKNKKVNGGSSPTANNGVAISGSHPINGIPGLAPFPSKASVTPPSVLATEEDRQHDYSLRPRSLADFVGQERIRKILAMSIAAARQRGEPLDHVLFSVPPGLGKTSLAHIIARELEKGCKRLKTQMLRSRQMHPGEAWTIAELVPARCHEKKRIWRRCTILYRGRG